MYVNTERLSEAVIKACIWHAGQVRKEASVPYVAHLWAVALKLARYGLSDDIIIAAILHDTLEDTGLKPYILESEFWPNVLRLVQAVSELPKSNSWEERKKEMIKRISSADLEVKIISCADKLDNLQSVCRALHAEGFREGQDTSVAKVWNSFNRGYDSQRWYYQSILESIFANVAIKDLHPIFGKFMRLVERTFQERIILNRRARSKVKSELPLVF